MHRPKDKVPKAELDLTELGVDGRIELAEVIGDRAPKSPIAIAQPAVAVAAKDTVDAGLALQGIRKTRRSLEQQLAETKGKERGLITVFDRKAKVYKAVAESYSEDPADLEGLGLRQIVPTEPVTELALGPVTLTSSNGAISMGVPALAPGWKYEGLVSEDPPTDTSYKEFPGTYAKRKVPGFTVGKRYWLKIRAVKGAKSTPWTEPTPILVR